MPAKNHLSQNQKQRLIKLLKESDDNYVRENDTRRELNPAAGTRGTRRVPTS
jgi:hypothetical protein